MSKSRLFVAALVIHCLLGSRVGGSDLEVSIRPHARQVIFGDPLYVEVTIVNRGQAAVTAPSPDLTLGTFELELYNPQTGLSVVPQDWGRGFGIPGQVRYEPGKPVKHYWIVFVPKLYRLKKDPFWKPVRKGGPIYLSGLYYLTRRLVLRSEGVDIGVQPREREEVETLKRVMNEEPRPYFKGPHPAGLGIQIRPQLNRDATVALAATVKSGELGDLLRLTIRLQDIYATPPEARDAENRALIEWLNEQPEIKRRALAYELRRICGSHHMTSTAKALEELISAP